MAFFPFRSLRDQLQLCWWFWLLFSCINCDEIVDFEDESNYLYYGNAEDHGAVQDYHPQKPYDSTLYEPSFLFGPNNPPRIVEFYAPWCPHCQHFRDHYVQFSKQIRQLGEENGVEIDVYAVSCQVYKKICRAFDVHSYPRILVFKAGATNTTAKVDYWNIHPFDVLNVLDIHVEQLKLDKPDETTANKKHGASSPSALEHKKDFARTKKNVYHDAHLSLVFALKNGIFSSSSEPLTNSTQDALHKWLNLLHYSLPPTWKVQKMVKLVLEDFHNVTQSEEKLIKFVAPHAPDLTQYWSPSCSKGNKNMGYTCGLWELFHIVTVGVVEWNLMIGTDDGELVLDTSSSALAIRNFVENFFGCEVCRVNFVAAYDSCFLDRCHRLIPEMSQASWIQLPVWLWEMHNAVNVRLLKEKYEREGVGRLPTLEEEHAVQWPSREECPICWNEDGSWDDVLIYKYLRLEYWPEDLISNEYRQLLFSVEGNVHDDSEGLVPPSVALRLFPLTILIVLAAGWYVKRMKVRRTGLHKKFDDSYRAKGKQAYRVHDTQNEAV